MIRSGRSEAKNDQLRSIMINTDVALPVILVVLKSDHKETKARQARQKLYFFFVSLSEAPCLISKRQGRRFRQS